MKGYSLNPDKDYVKMIIEGIHRKEGHCPCRIEKSDATLCPCDEFIREGICKCKLFIPNQEK